MIPAGRDSWEIVVARSKMQQARWEVWLALLLALIGGFVDAIGYIVLFHLFVGHMSGNSIDMMVEFGRGNWDKALHRAFPIPVFVVGVVIGAVLGEALFRRGIRSQFAAPFILEAALLILFFVLGAGAYYDGSLRPDSALVFYLLAALPALAMGVQNAAFRRVGSVSVRTTYISGMLTNFAEQAVEYGCWIYDQGHRGPGLLLALSPRQQSFRRMALYFSVWVIYTTGGIAGALAELRWGLWPLAAPAGILCAVAVRDLMRPIAPPKPPEKKPEWRQ